MSSLDTFDDGFLSFTMADPLQADEATGNDTTVYQEYTQQVEEGVPLPKWHPSAVG